MISLHIILGLFLLTCVIKSGTSCGGNSALEVVDMCKGGSTTDRHFYLHGSPAAGVQRCNCSLITTGAAGSVYFTPVLLADTTATLGGTLTLPDDRTAECTKTSRADNFVYRGTTILSFAYNTADVRCCVDLQLQSAETNISITCPGTTTTSTTSWPASTSISSTTSTTMAQSTTTITSISSPTTASNTTTTAPTTTTTPLHTGKAVSSSTSTVSATTSLSTWTSTTLPTSTPTSTLTSSLENRSTSYVTETQSTTGYSEKDSTTMASQAVSSFPVVAVAGGVGAGLLILLVVVFVVVLFSRRGRHVEKQEEVENPTSVITFTNNLYESSASISNTQPTKPPSIVEQQDKTPMVEGQVPLGLAPEQHNGTSGIAEQHDGTPGIADHHNGTPGIAAQQDGTPAIDEHRDGTSDMYAVVNKPKQSPEATKVNKQSVHTDPEKPVMYVDPDFSQATKSISPPSTEDNVIYAKVDKSSLKKKL